MLETAVFSFALIKVIFRYGAYYQFSAQLFSAYLKQNKSGFDFFFFPLNHIRNKDF